MKQIKVEGQRTRKRGVSFKRKYIYVKQSREVKEDEL